MTDDNLTTILEEAEHVAEQHDQVARTTDTQAHAYLRYVVLRVFEGEAEHLPTGWTLIDGVTVGYGSGDAMFDNWDSSGRLVETVPPQEASTRFRVFFPNDHQTVPHNIVNVMAALGAWRVWTGSAAACGSYDHRERREFHSTNGSPALQKLSPRTVDGLVTSATGLSSTITPSYRMNSTHARSVPSTKQWTPHSSQKVVATRSSPRPGTGTKST